jgi:protein-S-isoprenylcysteine O-methyltransferase Ste14
MRTTNWEFTNRALVFGLIFAFTFPLYVVDSQNAAATLAGWFAPRLKMDGDTAVRALFVLGALLTALAALVRTWASAYLHSSVVYASEVKTKALVADGPYRHVRNPLYFGNVLMSAGMGAMMSRTGFFVAILLTLVFCYRLIFREEADLAASQGESYRRYVQAVPRLLPSLVPKVAASGRPPEWSRGFIAEAWMWGFAVAVGAFAATLNTTIFFIVLAASIGLLWFSSRKAES